MANQYKSKVTNKYMGSTFAGQVRYSKETPLSDIVNAINRNTGKFENDIDEVCNLIKYDKDLLESYKYRLQKLNLD